MDNSLEALNKKYDLELEKVANEISKRKAKLVLLQFPDGLKPYATSVVDYFDALFQGKVEFLIWFGSCYGACDTPIGLEEIKPKIDLVVQFGHSEMLPSYSK
jgi:2-(3-amino-3-carboxypropyl)histidine synthase